MQRQTALITGASAGIGRSLALQFARHGYGLILVARRAAALEDLAAHLSRAHGVGARVLVVDLAQPDGPRTIDDALASANVQVDVLVNNAGFGLQGGFAQLPLQRQLDMIQVNITALTELTRRFLPGMLQRNRGGVLNVGSTAGFQSGPLMAVYYATKAYVLSFTEALAEEVAGSALRISCLAPGATASEFAAVAGMEKSNLFRVQAMDADVVARFGYDAWTRGKVLAIPGISNRIGAFSVRFAPRALVRRVIRRLNSVPPE